VANPHFVNAWKVSDGIPNLMTSDESSGEWASVVSA